jgi:hypothetical protein
VVKFDIHSIRGTQMSKTHSGYRVSCLFQCSLYKSKSITTLETNYRPYLTYQMNSVAKNDIATIRHFWNWNVSFYILVSKRIQHDCDEALGTTSSDVVSCSEVVLHFTCTTYGVCTWYSLLFWFRFGLVGRGSIVDPQIQSHDGEAVGTTTVHGVS